MLRALVLYATPITDFQDYFDSPYGGDMGEDVGGLNFVCESTWFGTSRSDTPII